MNNDIAHSQRSALPTFSLLYAPPVYDASRVDGDTASELTIYDEDALATSIYIYYIAVAMAARLIYSLTLLLHEGDDASARRLALAAGI